MVFLVVRTSKKTLRLWPLWCCPLWSSFLPTNFRRCDLPPCTPALGKDPPAMPRSLSRYLHSTGTLLKNWKKKHSFANGSRSQRKGDNAGPRPSARWWFSVQYNSVIFRTLQKLNIWFFIFWIMACCVSKGGASNKLHILVKLCLRRSYLSLCNPRSSSTLSSARHA